MIALFQDTSKLNIWKIIEDLITNFLSFLPNFIGAILVFLIGWIVARMLSKLVKKLLQTVGVDRLAEKLNQLELFYKNNIKIVPSQVFSKVLYYFLLVIFAVAATDILNMEVVSQLMGDLLNYIPVLISAVIIFLIGLVVADFIKDLVKSTCDSLGIPAGSIISNAVFYFIFLNITMITLSQAGIDTEFIQDNLSIVLAGIVFAFAIGYGIASRNIVANYLSGYYNKGKVNVGDVIAIEGVKGQVIDVTTSNIVLHTGDRDVIFPLSKLTSEKVEIFSRNSTIVEDE
ncbi:MAG TPA: mechanosensitive ion channel [Saprospiraceae bacterium]|nr:mechanosensitive ion channel [Saprospiraceae bacterium]HMQ84996.1 mechanosensitive ion channel [Saprospiraceae bacterium]